MEQLILLDASFLQTDNDKPSYGFCKKNGFGDLDAHVSLYKSVKNTAVLQEQSGKES